MTNAPDPSAKPEPPLPTPSAPVARPTHVTALAWALIVWGCVAAVPLLPVTVDLWRHMPPFNDGFYRAAIVILAPVGLLGLVQFACGIALLRGRSLARLVLLGIHAPAWLYVGVAIGMGWGGADLSPEPHRFWQVLGLVWVSLGAVLAGYGFGLYSPSARRFFGARASHPAAPGKSLA